MVTISCCVNVCVCVQQAPGFRFLCSCKSVIFGTIPVLFFVFTCYFCVASCILNVLRGFMYSVLYTCGFMFSVLVLHFIILIFVF